MGYGKRELSSTKHIILPKTKFVILDNHITPLPPHNGYIPLSRPQARVAVKLLWRGPVALFTEVEFLEYSLSYYIVVYLPNQIVVC